MLGCRTTRTRIRRANHGSVCRGLYAVYRVLHGRSTARAGLMTDAVAWWDYYYIATPTPPARVRVVCGTHQYHPAVGREPD